MEPSRAEYGHVARHDDVAAVKAPGSNFSSSSPLVIAMVMAATIWLFIFFKGIIVPFLIALFLMYMVDPIVKCFDSVLNRFLSLFCKEQKQFAVSRPLAAIMAIFISILLILQVVGICTRSVRNLDAKAYAQGVKETLDLLKRGAFVLGLDEDSFAMVLDKEIKQYLPSIERFVLSSVQEISETSVAVFIYLAFFLSTRTRPSDAGGVWVVVDTQIRTYIVLKSLCCVTIGVYVTAIYMLLNVGLGPGNFDVVWRAYTRAKSNCCSNAQFGASLPFC